MTLGITCIKNSLVDNFSYVAENVAVFGRTDIEKVFYYLFHALKVTKRGPIRNVTISLYVWLFVFLKCPIRLLHKIKAS